MFPYYHRCNLLAFFVLLYDYCQKAYTQIHINKYSLCNLNVIQVKAVWLHIQFDWLGCYLGEPNWLRILLCLIILSCTT